MIGSSETPSQPVVQPWLESPSAAQIVAASSSELLAAWEPESGGFARRFSQPGAPDSVSSNVQAGLDTLLNETVVQTELIANVKLGKPLGADTGGKIDPAVQESERAGASASACRRRTGSDYGAEHGAAL